MNELEIKVFKPRVTKNCVHQYGTDKKCTNKQVLAVEFLKDTGSHIEYFCSHCIKKIKKAYKH
jgi:predicted Zn-dependent protease